MRKIKNQKTGENNKTAIDVTTCGDDVMNSATCERKRLRFEGYRLGGSVLDKRTREGSPGAGAENVGQQSVRRSYLCKY